jgi:hypothetical protein
MMRFCRSPYPGERSIAHNANVIRWADGVDALAPSVMSAPGPSLAEAGASPSQACPSGADTVPQVSPSVAGTGASDAPGSSTTDGPSASPGAASGSATFGAGAVPAAAGPGATADSSMLGRTGCGAGGNMSNSPSCSPTGTAAAGGCPVGTSFSTSTSTSPSMSESGGDGGRSGGGSPLGARSASDASDVERPAPAPAVSACPASAAVASTGLPCAASGSRALSCATACATAVSLAAPPSVARMAYKMGARARSLHTKSPLQMCRGRCRAHSHVRHRGHCPCVGQVHGDGGHVAHGRWHSVGRARTRLGSLATSLYEPARCDCSGEPGGDGGADTGGDGGADAGGEGPGADGGTLTSS